MIWLALLPIVVLLVGGGIIVNSVRKLKHDLDKIEAWQLDGPVDVFWYIGAHRKWGLKPRLTAAELTEAWARWEVG